MATVAFIQKLPGMTDQDYAKLVAASRARKAGTSMAIRRRRHRHPDNPPRRIIASQERQPPLSNRAALDRDRPPGEKPHTQEHHEGRGTN